MIMHSRKQVAAVLDQILDKQEVVQEIEPQIVEEYKRLNEKCEQVICRIKDRKKRLATKES
jgi:hypothetical protein